MGQKRDTDRGGQHVFLELENVKSPWQLAFHTLSSLFHQDDLFEISSSKGMTRRRMVCPVVSSKRMTLLWK